MSTKHSIAAGKVLGSPQKIDHHDKTFWSVRAKRDILSKQLVEWEELRNAADMIKRHTITHLSDYLEEFERNATNNGAIVHWAKDDTEFNEIILDILRSHNISKVVKGKSMLTEECHLNEHLKKNGIEAIETDLGERILQLMELAPGHIIMPAIHITKEQVKECFREKGLLHLHGIQAAKSMGLDSNEEIEEKSDPTYLTRCARYHLRDNFMDAGCGITGTNFAVASTGEVVVCTNEGNADMSTSIPKLHIACMGLEKIIPDYNSLAVFHRLLARHGTGQATTVYTSHFKKPRPGCEFHIIIVDNGRSDILANQQHWQTLKCMRCGACMNTCPVYRRSTGYSYTYFIPGPIGINLGMLKDYNRNYHNLSACSLCCSCDNVCPVKVDLSTQIYKWRQTLDENGHADTMKKMISRGMKVLFDHPVLYNKAVAMAPFVNHIPDWITYSRYNAWCKYHSMPEFAKNSFHQMWKKGEVK